MKRTLLVLLVLGLVGGLMTAPGASAKKPKTRTFEGTYTCPCGFQVAGQGPAFRLGSGEGGFQVPIVAGEASMSLELTDDSGLPVFFEITQDVDGDGTLYEHSAGAACGKTDGAVSLEPGAPVVVFVQSGTCDTGVGIATGGKFKAVIGR